MKKWQTYSLIALVPLLGGIAARLLRVVIAFSLRDIGVSVFDITILSSSYMLSRALFSPFIGKFADKGYSRYIIIIIGFAGLLVDSQLYLLSPYSVMIALRVLDGLYGAMVWPTMQAVVHFSSPKNYRARIMSFYFIMGSLGSSLGYVAYSYFVGNVVYALYLIAIVYVLEISFSFRFRKVKEEREKKEQKIEKKMNVPMFTLSFLFGMYMSLGNEVLLFYLAEVMNLGKVDSTTVLFLGSLFALMGSVLIGHIADRRGFVASVYILGIFAILSGLFISINNIFFVIGGVFIFFIAGRGFLPISRSFTASFSKNVGVFLGFINLSSNIGSVIGPLIGGFILDYFSSAKFLIFNLSGLIFLIFGLIIIPFTFLFGKSQARLSAD